MATASAKARVRERPAVVTAILSAVGYALVIGTFVADLPIYPELTLAQVDFLTHAIAVVNTLATALIVLGWYWIRKGAVQKHKWAMLGAFGLILLFLLMYLPKVGGGGTKEFVGPTLPYYAYLLMLAVHVILSIIAVPVVLHAVVLGVSYTPSELPNTAHPRVGRIAALSWTISLVLGVITYLMLNHVYGWEFAAATMVVH